MPESRNYNVFLSGIEPRKKITAILFFQKQQNIALKFKSEWRWHNYVELDLKS